MSKPMADIDAAVMERCAEWVLDGAEMEGCVLSKTIARNIVRCILEQELDYPVLVKWVAELEGLLRHVLRTAYSDHATMCDALSPYIDTVERVLNGGAGKHE
jgi:hypothetical protein